MAYEKRVAYVTEEDVDRSRGIVIARGDKGAVVDGVCALICMDVTPQCKINLRRREQGNKS
jgi:hypothetical protein